MLRSVLKVAALGLLLSHCSSNSGLSGNTAPARSAPTTQLPPPPVVAPATAGALAGPGAVPAAQPLAVPPPTAIVKGSFTIWPVPAHPLPGKSYILYCSIQLPANVSNYSLYDLSGAIHGTDAYNQAIGATGSPHMQQFTTSGTQALLLVQVPGADPNVRDSITVSSSLLGENQTASLVFGY